MEATRILSNLHRLVVDRGGGVMTLGELKLPHFLNNNNYYIILYYMGLLKLVVFPVMIVG